jgi:hypothetical protein
MAACGSLSGCSGSPWTTFILEQFRCIKEEEGTALKAMDIVGVQGMGHRYLIMKICLVGSRQEVVDPQDHGSSLGG